jgi:hypothetical protein
LSQQVRLPDELYTQLQQIKHSLDPDHFSDTPSIQDMVTVGVKRLVDDWNNPDKQGLLLAELLEHRKIARSRMGRKKAEG